MSISIDLIKGSTDQPLKTMLHLGSGAGFHDIYFKQHFDVTGVDLSLGMLEKARRLHPDIEYHEGDMRTIRLNKKYDIVAIPDSIDYMVTKEDLRQVFETAVTHLKPGGILFIIAKTEEIFKNNNFAYEGVKEDVQVTLLENNYMNPYRPNTYEATLVYMIREHGELTMHTENQVLGLFSLKTWKKLFDEYRLNMISLKMEGIYDDWILADGEYPMMAFIGQKLF